MIEKIKNYLFENTSFRQTLIKNTFWVALGTTTIKIIRGIIIIYVARILGAGQYGIFTYAMSIVGIFMIFADLGLTSITIRELSKDGEEKYSYLSTAFVIKIALLVFTLILAAFIGPIISKFPESSALIFFISAFVAIESLRNFLYAIPRAQNKMQTEAGLGIFSEIISIFVILFIFFKNPTAENLTLAYIIGNGLGFLLSLGFLRRSFKGLFGHFKKSLLKPIFLSSWPLAVMGVFGIFMTNIDSVMLGFWYKPETLGMYAAAQKPISLLYILPGFLSSSLFPLISKLISSDRARIGAFVEKAYRASLAIGLPIIIGGVILAGPIISVTFGPEYSGSVLTFQILILTLLTAFPGAIFSDLIMAEDKQKIFIRSTLFGSITNVVLNFILIPTYGIAGSAIATVISQTVATGIIYGKVQDSFKLKLFARLGKILISVIFMGLVAIALKSIFAPLILIVPICIATYLVFLVILKEKLLVDIRESWNDR